MEIFLDLSFLFCIGSTLGYIIEVFFRRFFSAHRWTNPGFLNGPFLPIYGFGLLFFYSFSIIKLPYSYTVNSILIIMMIGAAMTLIEYIAGLIFIKGMNIKLWDYSNIRGNIQGIICPLFSIIWLDVGALYYFVLHQYIFVPLLTWFNSNIVYASYFLGVAYGLLIYDLVVSFNLVAKISKAAKSSKVLVSYEQFKISRSDAKKKRKQAFLKDNPILEDFIEQQKKRSAELMGRIVFKDASAKAIKDREDQEKAAQENQKDAK
jgi:uncharacterized membrane protein